MATSDQANYVPPTCEDYHSEDSGVLESFTGRKSPAAANVSTKRSHPSDLDKEKPPAQERAHTNIDLRSDSGYSSLTAATVSSADSAPSATVAPPHSAPLASQSPTPKTRRPTVSSDQRQHSSSSSPRPKPLSRTASQSSRRPPAGQRRPTLSQDRRDREEEDCADPNCTKCGPNALPRRRLDLLPSQSARTVAIPSDQRSMQSDPAAYYASPPSPTYTRQPTYLQGPAVVQPAQPRRRSSSTTRPRPMSYSGEPGASYWVPGMPAPYPSPPQDRRPPPAPSAYRNMPQYHHMPSGPQMASYMAPHTQPNGYYAQQQYPVQTTPPYDLQRPAPSTRNSSAYGTRNQPAPIVTQDRREHHRHSARYGPPQSATQTKFPLQIGNEAYESPASDSSSEEEYEDPRNTRAPMPPPKVKRPKSQTRRPSLRHAATTQVVDRLERRQSIVVPERPKDRGRAPRVSDASTRVSTSRPPAPSRQTQSEYDTRPGRVVVNNTKASRRQSAQIYDKMYEQYAQAKAIEERYAKAKALEEQMAKDREIAETKALLEAEARAREEQYKAEQRRQKRSSKAYYPPVEFVDDDDDESEEEERPVRPREVRRRPTVSESRKAKERVATSAAEDYISAQRGSQVPYSDQIHSAAKRASRMPSGPSKSGSSRSEGSDKQSQSARTVATTNGNNEIRLRVDASAPLSLQFNGDMEGRTLQLLPAENGMADIVIGNARGGENAYHTSERGSILGSSRRSMIANHARRDAEEMTERSSRSVRSRREGRGGEIRGDRDGQRHVLQRYRN